MPNQQKLAMLKNSSQAKRRLLRVKPFAAAFTCVGPGLVRILIMGIIPPMVFARAAVWEVVETSTTAAGQTNIVFRLPQTQVPPALWPHKTELELNVSVGDTLELQLITRNRGLEPGSAGVRSCVLPLPFISL